MSGVRRRSASTALPLWLRRLPEWGTFAAVVVSFVVVDTGHWRRGLAAFGGCLLFAAVLRLTMPARDVPMLINRSRRFDATVLIALGTSILGLAFWVVYPRPF